MDAAPPVTLSVGGEASSALGGTIGSKSMGGNTAPAEKGNGGFLGGILAESAHPVALLTHYAFRTAALMTYLFGPLLFFGDAFVAVFVLTVVLLALDFWAVKNVTGRILVGRRWWSSTASDGSTVWRFEMRPTEGYRPNPTDSRLFWLALYSFTLMWTLLGLAALLQFNFSWLVLVVFAVSLNFTNLVGYLKCDSSHQHTATTSPMLNALMGSFLGNRVGAFFK